MHQLAGEHQTDIRRAAMMGFVAGLRSQVPFFVLSQAARTGAFAVDTGRPLSWLRDSRAQVALGLSAVGEMIADKTPFVPNRTDPGPLFGRLAIGTSAGAAIASDVGASLVEGAVAGAIGAAIGSFAGMHGRRWLKGILGVPDVVVALAEDGLTLVLGHRAALGELASTSPKSAPTA